MMVLHLPLYAYVWNTCSAFRFISITNTLFEEWSEFSLGLKLILKYVILISSIRVGKMPFKICIDGNAQGALIGV